MKKSSTFAMLLLLIGLCLDIPVQGQAKKAKTVPEYDTIIRKHVTRPLVRPIAKGEVVLPTPEFINQPYYYDKTDNRLINLESATAQMITKKKILGLKGAKQLLSMAVPSSKVRFTAKANITFLIKTSGDVIDLTSYIKLYKFMPTDQKREVTLAVKEGMMGDNEEQKGKLISFSVKMLSKENYLIQLSEALTAGEYGFVWLKNMELQEFSVFAFGIDWKNSD